MLANGDHDGNKHDPVEDVSHKKRDDGSKPKWPLSCTTTVHEETFVKLILLLIIRLRGVKFVVYTYKNELA